MAKKGKDLFELLRARQGGSTGRSPRSAPTKKTPPRPVGQTAQKRRSWGWRVLGAMKLVKSTRTRVVRSRPTGKRGQADKNRRADKQRKAGGAVPTPPVVTGLALTRMGLAAIILVCLGAGFLAGQWLAPTDVSGPGGELRAGIGRQPSLPDWMPTSEERQEEVKTLSKYFFVLLHFPGSERDRASHLARFLRGQGLETARIREFKTEKTRQSRWAALVYVLRKSDAPAVLDKLKAVQPPTFEPDLAARLAALSGSKHLMQLDH